MEQDTSLRPERILDLSERLSSVAADEYVTATRGRRPRPRERLDHVAAAIILQDYLDSRP